jgi:hypothetical protein
MECITWYPDASSAERSHTARNMDLGSKADWGDLGTVVKLGVEARLVQAF